MNIYNLIELFNKNEISNYWIFEKSPIDITLNPTGFYTYNYALNDQTITDLYGNRIINIYAGIKGNDIEAIFIILEKNENLQYQINKELGISKSILSIGIEDQELSPFQWEWTDKDFELMLKEIDKYSINLKTNEYFVSNTYNLVIIHKKAVDLYDF